MPLLIVADLMERELTTQKMALPLRRMVVKRYATQILSVATFHTLLHGTIVCFAPNVISLTTDPQGPTHLGRRPEQVYRFIMYVRIRLLHFPPNTKKLLY